MPEEIKHIDILPATIPVSILHPMSELRKVPHDRFVLVTWAYNGVRWQECMCFDKNLNDWAPTCAEDIAEHLIEKNGGSYDHSDLSRHPPDARFYILPIITDNMSIEEK